jgi:hypothetical protein
MGNELLTDLELAGIRADVAGFFVDTCTITRVTEEGALNHATAQFAAPTTITVYSGACSIYPIESRRDRFDEFGQGLVYTRQYRVVLPWTEDDVQIRDDFVATVSDDPQLIGRPMEVRDVIVSTNLGYRRLTVQDTRE